MFAELGDTPAEDKFYVVDYDGDYRQNEGGALVVGTGEPDEAPLLAIDRSKSVEEIVAELHTIWKSVAGGEDEADRTAGLTPEALILDRQTNRENVFRSLPV